MALNLGARAWLAAALASGWVAAAAAQDNAAATEAPSAAGPQSGWYVSGGVGISRYRVPGQQKNEHDTLTGHGGKLMLGYQVRRWLRLEAGAVSLGSDWQTDPAIAIVGAVHLGDHVALLGRLGAYHRRTARTDTWLLRTEDKEGTEATVGVGVEWYLQPRLSALLEVESYESFYIFASDRGANMTTLSLRYRF
jgi:hypothetical protein